MSFPLSEPLERLRRMFEAHLDRPLTPEEVRLLELTGPLDDPDEPMISLPRYQDWSKEVTVLADSEIKLAATLDKSPEAAAKGTN